MATQNYEVFKTDLEISLKNAQQTLKDLKQIQAGLKGMGGYSADLSKNFGNLQKTLKNFSSRNVSVFGKDFSNYINKTNSEFEKLDATIDSLFKRLPRKAEPAVMLLQKRFQELRREAKTTDEVLNKLARYETESKKLEKAIATPGLGSETVASFSQQLEIVKAKRQAILDKLKEEGRTVEDVQDLYKQQLKSLGEMGQKVKQVGEQQAIAAEFQRKAKENLTQTIAEQQRLIREKEKELATAAKLQKADDERQARITKEQERFDLIEARRASLRSKGAMGINRQAIGEAFTGIKAAGDIPITGLGSIVKVAQQVGKATADLRRDFGDITAAATLFGATGGNAFVAMRRAIFGMSEPTGRLGKLLDYAVASTTSFSKATNALTADAGRLAGTIATSVNSLREQGDALKNVAKDEGLAATMFVRFNEQIRKGTNELENLQASIQRGTATPKTITAYIKAVQNLNNQFDNLEHTLVEVYKHPADSATLKMLRAMRPATSEVERNLQQINANLNAVDKGGSFFDKLKRGAMNLIAPFKMVKKSEDEMAEGAFKLSGGLDESTKKAGLLSTAVAGAAKQATVFSEAMKGAIIGSFLGPIFQQALAAVGKLFNILTTPIRLPFEALLAPFKILSGLIDTITGQIQQFFASLPGQFMSANNLVQNFNVTLTQMLSGFDKDKIEKSLRGANEYIRKVIAKTPFELATGQAAFQQLITSGFDPKKWLLPAADAAAAMNKEMGQLIFAMQRLKAGSKGMGVDMLRDFGIPVQQVGVWLDGASGKMVEANKVLGKSKEELAAAGYAWKQWKFDAAGSLEQTPVEALDILNGYLQQNAIFAGASAARSRTLTGVLSNLNDAVTTLLTAFGQPIFKAITAILSDIYDVVSEITTAVEPFVILIGTELANSMQTLWTNITGIGAGFDEMGNKTEGAIARIKEIASSVIQFLKPALMVILAIVKGDWPKAWGLFLKAAQDVVRKVGDWLKGSGKEWLQWGVGLIKNLATGITTAAKTLIRGAVSAVGRTISSFLRPGSPPKEGPLKDIDKWGAGLIKTFTGSFKTADFDFLSPITDAIKGSMEKMGLDQFKAVRQNIVAIIGGINQTGVINEELWAKVQQQIGAGNAELSQFVRLNLELKKVTKEYQDAEAAGFVPKELQDRLEAAKVAVQLKEEELKLQDQINQSAKEGAGAGGAGGDSPADRKKALEDELKLLKKRKDVGLISAKEYLSGVADLRRRYADESLLAGDEGTARKQVEEAKKIDKELFDQDRKFLEKKKKLGLVTEAEYLSQLQDMNKQEAERLLEAGDEAGARARIEEAKNLQKQIEKVELAEQRKALEKQIEQERKILEMKYQKGLITEQEYREGLVRLQEGYIDQLMALGFPVDNEIEKLKSYKEELKKLTDVQIDQPQDLLASFGDEVTGELQTMMDDILKEFNTLGTSTWEEFTNTFHDAFDGIWEDITSSIFGEGTEGGFGSLKENIMAWAAGLWTDLTAEGGPLSDMTEFFNRISEGFLGWSQGQGQEAFTQVGVVVGEALVNGIKTALGLTGGENRVVNEFAASISSSTATFFTAFSTVAGAAVSGFIQGVTGLGQQAADVIGRGIVDGLNPWGSQVVQTIFSTINDAMSVTDWLLIVSPIFAAFQWLYDQLVGHSLIPDMMTEIVTLFEGLPTLISDLNLAETLMTIFDGIYDKMVTAGESLIQGFIDGVKTKLADLQALMEVEVAGHSISDFFPFSPAKRGPLSRPIGWIGYLTEGVQAAVGTLGGMLTNGVAAASQAVNQTLGAMLESVRQTAREARDTLENMDQEGTSGPRLNQPLGSGFGNYGHRDRGGPSIGEQGGIAASWRRFFKNLRERGSISNYGGRSYAKGTTYVPSTGKAQLHKGEMVIPADIAQRYREAMSRPYVNPIQNGMTISPTMYNTATRQMLDNPTPSIPGGGQALGQGTQNYFEEGAFANAFPNITDASQANGFISTLQQMINRSDVRARTV